MPNTYISIEEEKSASLSRSLHPSRLSLSAPKLLLYYTDSNSSFYLSDLITIFV